jgi:DNA topoisomerase I
MTNLMIVDSPAKAKRIADFLGKGWRVEACLGQVRDLPEHELGIDIKADFQPTYSLLKGKTNLARRLRKAMQLADAIYMATDPDREGEVAAWHLLEVAQPSNSIPVYRVLLDAISADGVAQAIAGARPLDGPLIEAQQTRRLIDRLTGYLISPLATKALGDNFSVGRLQSVCLRLLMEREQEIATFRHQPVWTFSLQLEASGEPFNATLATIKGAGLPLKNLDVAERLAALISKAHLWVETVGESTQYRQPASPFTTSTLQQAAASLLGLSPDRTMALAELLYETGVITYIRTNGLTVAAEAQSAARILIERDYGMDYLPPLPPSDDTKSVQIQEAHEAIRPTDIMRQTHGVKGNAAALYNLIWRRFIASQMKAAQYQTRNAQIYAANAIGKLFPLAFHAQTQTLIFDGFLKIYEDTTDVEQPSGDVDSMPTLHDGQLLELLKTEISEVQTSPPLRYTEDGLIEALVGHGISILSTHGNLLKLLKDNTYVELDDKHLIPTRRGKLLNDFLTPFFNDLLSVDYSARLEVELDQLSAGKQSRGNVLHAFWAHFQLQVKTATEHVLAERRARHLTKPLTLRPMGEETHEQPIV